MNYLFLRFFISAWFLSIPLVGILGIQKLFKKSIVISWKYYIWYLLFFILVIPFLPPLFVNQESSLLTSSFASVVAEHDFTLSQNQEFHDMTGWQNDFAVSVQGTYAELNAVMGHIWFLGLIIFACFTGMAFWRLYQLKQSFCFVEEDIRQLFEQCQDEMKLKSRKIRLVKSKKVKTPMIFGLWHPVVVLPEHILKYLSACEIRYILYHELHHYRNKDIWMNYVICFFQTIYWFQPFVWLAFRQMRSEREVLCDLSVLNMLHEDCHRDYGMTILHFVETMSNPLLLPVTMGADMGGTKKQIRKRIENISAYTRDNGCKRRKSICLFLFMSVFILMQSPMVSIMAQSKQTVYEMKEENVVYEDLSQYFDGFDGSFVLFDKNKGQYQIYNKENSETRYSPNSTYKIYSGLMALEANVIQENQTQMQWDGVHQPIEQWNQDQDLSTAMKYSVNWYFTQLDQWTGFQTIQEKLKEMEYGNCDFSGGEGAFWLQSSLKISPLEQVKLLQKLHDNQLHFQEKNMEIIKSTLRLEQKENAAIFGKTGTGMLDYEDVNGWFVGYVEKEGNTYFFATNIQGKTEATGSKASEITFSILEDKRIY